MIDKDIVKNRLDEVLIHYGASRGSGKNWDCITARHKSQKSAKNDLSISEGKDGQLVCCCHCGVSGDAFKVIEVMEGISDFKGQMIRACEILGIEHDSDAVYKTPIKKEIITEDKKVKLSDNSLLIGEWHKNVNQTFYYRNRGLTEKTINKYKLGFNESGGKYGKAFKYSLPVSNEYVIFREDGDANGRYRNTASKAEILNLNYIHEQNDYIFITEGYFDALSIEELNHKAISLNSTANATMLIDYIKMHHEDAENKTFILISDNDASGKKLQDKLKSEISIEVFNLDEKYNDVNEYLIKDKERLQADLKSFIAKQKSGDYVISYMDEFLKDVEVNSKKPIISTGFKSMDEKMGGGIFAGLYVIGGISSLGKTAFTLQIADYIASKGTDVIFFSLEMSKFELISRSISRNLYKIDNKKCWDCGTLKVSRGQFKDIIPEMHDAMREYEYTEENLIIKEGNFDTNIDSIRDTVKAHIERTGKKPVVFIDYLQILKGKGAGNDKQEMDFVSTELKRISRDYDISVFVVSSFSRANYYNKVGMESFKESGAIEYTADVLIGLQLTILNELDLSTEKKRVEGRSAISTAKEEMPRSISAVFLKQRNAKPSEMQNFIFHPVNNYMQEV